MSYSGLKYEDIKKNPLITRYLCSLVGIFNTSAGVKCVVQLGLYGNSILGLGTAKHNDYLKRAYNLKDLGCFMMTELGHGSNVQQLLTTAHYIHSERAFVLNTPHELGMKFWIGNLGRTANMGVCFANLIINNKNEGIHVFLVKIRNDKGDILPGINLGDCGPKFGMNGIDNGWVIFRRVKIPYDFLLDKFS